MNIVPKKVPYSLDVEFIKDRKMIGTSKNLSYENNGSLSKQ